MRMRIAIVIGVGAALLATGSAQAGVDVKPLYDKYCKVCHSIAGDGGKQAEKGGALDGVGSKRDGEWLKKYLADPKSVIPDAKMPKLKMTDEELDAYIQYMLSLK